jgi:hypothetical protein
MTHLIKLTIAIQNPFHTELQEPEARLPVWIDPTKIEAMGRKTLVCKREVFDKDGKKETETRISSWTDVVIGDGKYLYRVAETPERILELQQELLSEQKQELEGLLGWVGKKTGQSGFEEMN